MSARYDVIVLGVGGMGSAAAFELARRGRKVLGLEQFSLAHDRGSSHGQTRIIRSAYYEHPNYVPLVRRAFERWYDLEQRTGRHLLTDCDCLGFGTETGEVIAGVRASADRHGLSVENLSASELRRRFPQFRFGDDHVGVLEHEAGFLYVEECVRAHIYAARSLGAEIHAEEPALSWEVAGNGVTVRTAKAAYSADRLVLTAGSWAPALLTRYGAKLSVMRQVLLWFGTSDPAQFRRDRFPIFIGEVPEGYFYGLPVIDPAGLKIARHYGAPELPGPEAVDRGTTPADEAPVRQFLADHIPAANGPLTKAQVCTYTLTPDRHFVIDLHPEHPEVSVAAGFSGHGFKFAAAVGEALADLAEKGRTALPIGMFGIGRFK